MSGERDVRLPAPDPLLAVTLHGEPPVSLTTGERIRHGHRCEYRAGEDWCMCPERQDPA